MLRAKEFAAHRQCLSRCTLRLGKPFLHIEYASVQRYPAYNISPRIAFRLAVPDQRLSDKSFRFGQVIR